MDKLLSVREVSERLLISEKTCQEWLRSGRLPGFKPLGQWRIREKDLDDFIREQAEKR